MAAKLRSKKHTAISNAKSEAVNSRKRNSPGWNLSPIYAGVFITIGLSLVSYLLYANSTPHLLDDDLSPTKTSDDDSKRNTADKSKTQQSKGPIHDKKERFPDNFQAFLRPQGLLVQDREITFTEVKHNNSQSSVRVYLFDNVLSNAECDGLCAVHSKHVINANKMSPLFCFDTAKTLYHHLNELNLKYAIQQKDFVKGTSCLNATMSAMLKPHFKFSYSTAFYTGENKFSIDYGDRLEKITGLQQTNGGKFQITSYGQSVGYKSHLDCVEDDEKRDRYATALVYLSDVKEGGETVFPRLNISVRPKKGRLLLWNSMDSKGVCDPTSLHHAAPVIKGHKFILQRWYYYKSFPSLGRRPQEPQIPLRQEGQPRIHCDNYQFGSCRWYDEWGYDHLLEYNLIKNKLQ